MRWLATAMVGLVGCGGGEPDSGTWVYSNEVEEENTCGVPYGTTSGEFLLTNNGDGTLVIDADDGTDPFVCTLDGGAYDCPQRYVEDVELGLGAVAEVRVSAEGTFRSATSGTGTQTGTFSCKDATCSAMAALAGIPDPCTVAVSYDIAWSGPLP